MYNSSKIFENAVLVAAAQLGYVHAYSTEWRSPQGEVVQITPWNGEKNIPPELVEEAKKSLRRCQSVRELARERYNREGYAATVHYLFY